MGSKSAILRSLLPACDGTSRPRDRIMATARDLFRRYGIRAVGVDAIAEAAGSNKMTLYRHFGSKDDLVCACLRDVAREVENVWVEIDAGHPDDARAQLQDWVCRSADLLDRESRGCDLANAAVELTEDDHPARRLIETVKTAQRDRLSALCRAAGAPQPDLLADTLSCLLEGARVSRQSVGAEGPSARFRRMSEAVIASFGIA